MNNEMAYLLGMITGNGEIQRGANETTVVIEIPHKKLETEFERNVAIYVKASITDIREMLEPLLGTSLRFLQNKNVSYISFSKKNEDYLMREILRYSDKASSHNNIRISKEVFDFTSDERKQFIKGFADVTGYIRKSNYYFKKEMHRVYFEIPQNWYLVADFCNLLKSVDVPVQNIDWAHPNMRDGKMTKYNEGKVDFWKKEHQVKVWANEYEPIGFAVIRKNEALEHFAEEQITYIELEHKKVKDVTHKYYWELAERNREKPLHPGESDDFIPEEIRGRHYNSWKEIAHDLGYKNEEED